MKSRKFLVLFISTMTLFAFQNCGQQSPKSEAGTSEVVVASTQNIMKVTYDPELETSPTSLIKPLLTVDLANGQMSVRNSQGQVKSCAIDDVRRATITSILSDGKVCRPIPPTGETQICMALSLADVKLEGYDVSIYLRPEICSNGSFLCDRQDPAFRSALADLLVNPPDTCK